MKQIAVISGKGGTGKSSISAAFATMNGKVVLADCDVDAANLFLLFNPVVEDEQAFVSGYKAIIDYSVCNSCGRCMDFCRFGAISTADDKVIIDEISCDGCFLCSRICSENAIKMVANDRSRLFTGSFRNGKMVYGRLAPGEENSGKLVNLVRERSKQICNENELTHIIIDGPPGIGCPVISSITGTDLIIIVTEPTQSGLSDMGRAADVVAKFGLRPYVIINKSDLNLEMTEKIKDFCGENDVEVTGTLPFNSKMVESMVNGKTIIEYDPENPVSKELKKIWNKFLNIL